MNWLTGMIIESAVRFLPQQERRRYAEEFYADRRSQTSWRRLASAVSIALAIPRLRWVLLRRLAGQPVPFCFLGMHRDLTTHPNSEASRVLARECVLCHRTSDRRSYSTRRHMNDDHAWFPARDRR